MTKDRIDEEVMKSMFLPSEERKEKEETMIENLNWSRRKLDSSGRKQKLTGGLLIR